MEWILLALINSSLFYGQLLMEGSFPGGLLKHDINSSRSWRPLQFLNLQIHNKSDILESAHYTGLVRLKKKLWRHEAQRKQVIWLKSACRTIYTLSPVSATNVSQKLKQILKKIQDKITRTHKRKETSWCHSMIPIFICSQGSFTRLSLP